MQSRDSRIQSVRAAGRIFDTLAMVRNWVPTNPDVRQKLSDEVDRNFSTASQAFEVIFKGVWSSIESGIGLSTFLIAAAQRAACMFECSLFFKSGDPRVIDAMWAVARVADVVARLAEETVSGLHRYGLPYSTPEEAWRRVLAICDEAVSLEQGGSDGKVGFGGSESEGKLQEIISLYKHQLLRGGYQRLAEKVAEHMLGRAEQGSEPLLIVRAHLEFIEVALRRSPGSSHQDILDGVDKLEEALALVRHPVATEAALKEMRCVIGQYLKENSREGDTYTPCEVIRRLGRLVLTRTLEEVAGVENRGSMATFEALTAIPVMSWSIPGMFSAEELSGFGERAATLCADLCKCPENIEGLRRLLVDAKMRAQMKEIKLPLWLEKCYETVKKRWKGG